MDTPTSPCPSCFADRLYPLTMAEGIFLPASDCPECGHVAPDVTFEHVPAEGSEDRASTLTLDADGVITRSAADGVITPASDGVIAQPEEGVITAATAADGQLDTIRPDDRARAEDYARDARQMGVDPDLVFAALASRTG